MPSQLTVFDCLRAALAAAMLGAGLAPAAATAAESAARVQQATPQGEVALVRQVSLRFDQAVVPLGDPRLPAPAELRCQGTPVAGNSRWLNPKEWVLDLPAALPPSQRCSLALRADWKPLLPVQGPQQFDFSTAGPAVARIWPQAGLQIEEQQHFLLQLTGPAPWPKVVQDAWCEVQGLGERIPVQRVEGAPLQALVAQYKLAKQADQLLLLACQRPFAPQAKVRLMWGLAGRDAQRFEWPVRERFEASFSCERENAEAACMPLRPLRVAFSSGVPRAQALAATLQAPGGAALRAVAPAYEQGDSLRSIEFAAPLQPLTRYRLSLPAGLRDESGRPLGNAAAFPLDTTTGAMPPLAKFAAAPFGILESGPEAMLPITVRHVQSDLSGLSASGQVRIKRLDASSSDAELMRWLALVRGLHERSVSVADAAPWLGGLSAADQPVRDQGEIASRELSLLRREAGVSTARLPMLDKPASPASSPDARSPRPFEVLGIPLPQPGYHVVEVESRLLGAQLLSKPLPMYVRSGALVTNLGVHFKRGHESSLVWVTTLDRARPVAGAQVQVSDCTGKPVWSGSTDAQGMARIGRGFFEEQRACKDRWAWFVSARAPDAAGRPDLAFVYSDSIDGIEPWRFNQPMAYGELPELSAHSVLDRSLLRVGETVSMKHLVRRQTTAGLQAVPPEALPTELLITHQGSGEQIRQPLRWRDGAAAGSALSQWAIPNGAKLGSYQLSLVRGDREWPSGNFRVEAFRLPLVDARLTGPSGALVAPAELPLDVQLSYLNGGGLAQAPASVSALLRERINAPNGHEAFSFRPPVAVKPGGNEWDDAADAVEAPADKGRIVAERLPLRTDAKGAARVLLKPLPALTGPSELLTELTFTDPNGEVQTVSRSLALWSSAVQVGLRSRSWMARGGQAALQAVVLDPQGRPVAGQAVKISARLDKTLSTRKRMVGGFYAWEHHTRSTDLGAVCQGKTDARGLLDCDAALGAEAGQVQLTAEALDSQGRPARAADSVWVSGQGELWFAQDNDDRIDLLPEQAELQPGQTARLQVRMPFREATALVTVEREGLLHSQVVTLRGSQPVIELAVPGANDPAAASWAPNVYVSVLVLRGRVREVPWTSFFDWGWRTPREWWQAWRHEGPVWQPPTAMVDLAKPAFKLGVAALKIGQQAHRLDVQVQPDKTQYGVRQTARVTVTVRQNGQPAAGAQVAFAAVDEALLALRPNDSWNLLDAMFQPRGWGVETSTAQGEVIGRRHYGRKAVPAGGGGGRNPTRELFDTLLLWQPEVTLDARGQATLQVPLNDSLSRFRLVAVANAAGPRGGQAGVPDRFGTGSATLDVTQDLQILPGLPPLVREGDQFSATVTLRNTTGRSMKLLAQLSARGEPAATSSPAQPLKFADQTLTLAAGAAQELQWPVTVPAGLQRLQWQISAAEQGGAARDSLSLAQAVQPAVPLRMWQASLQPLAGPLRLPVAPPEGALTAEPGALPSGPGAKRGGVQLGLQASLAGPMPGVRRFFVDYPFNCLEQRASRAVGLQDAAAWTALMSELPAYLDSDGLAGYYPAPAGAAANGSDRLSAYLLSLADEAGLSLPDAQRERLLGGLTAFVEGRIERRFAAPRADLDVRKLAALEALSRHGRALPRQFGSLQITPAQWPTAALIDWWLLLQRLDGLPDRARRLDEANRLLRSRLDLSSQSLRFVDEESDFWWWLMDNADGNANRLVLAALAQPAWQDDLPRLMLGALSRQQRGAWLTTTANAWGTLAARRFAARFEAQPVTGSSRFSLGAARVSQDWAAPAAAPLNLPWPADAGNATLLAEHSGSGKPWLTVQILAAVPLTAPLEAGYSLQRSITPVTQKVAGRWSRGDVLRVKLIIDARASMSWVAISDPLPAGATVLGSGLGRDSQIAVASEAGSKSGTAPAYIERATEAWRAIYDWLPKGQHTVEYTVRLNSSGRFQLPTSRIEAMYAPASFAERPNAPLDVQP